MTQSIKKRRSATHLSPIFRGLSKWREKNKNKSHAYCRGGCEQSLILSSNHSWFCSGKGLTSGKLLNKIFRWAFRACPKCTIISFKTISPLPAAIRCTSMCSRARCSARNFARISGTCVFISSQKVMPLSYSSPSHFFLKSSSNPDCRIELRAISDISVMERSKLALATAYSSRRASSDIWKRSGSSVDKVTFRPLLNSFGKGFSLIFLNKKLFDRGLRESPIWSK